MAKDADKQAVDFFIKRATITTETADRHIKDQEYTKGMNLYKQAYAFFLKAQKARPDDEILKENINSVKIKYQNAKMKAEEEK